MIRQSSFVFLLHSRSRAFVIGAPLCAMVSAAMAAVAYQHERTGLLGREGVRLANLARLTAALIDRCLESGLRDMAALAEFGPFNRDPIDIPVGRDALEIRRRCSSSFSWVALADREGRVLAATRGVPEGEMVGGRPWHSAGLRGPYLGAFHPGRPPARALPTEDGGATAFFLDIAPPVRRSDGEAVGVVAGRMDWQCAAILREQLLDAAIDRGSLDLILADRDGRVAFGSGYGLPVASGALPLAQPTGGAARWSFRAPEGGPGLMVATGSLVAPGLDWSVHALRPVEEVAASADERPVWLTLGCVGIALACGAAAACTGYVLVRAVRAMSRQAHRHARTGLLNRSGFEAWRKACPDPAGSAQLVAFDLHDFKPVNDRHGHAVGDEVLAALGTWLLAHIRTGDAAVRLGGDALVVCLPGAPCAAGERFAAHVRALPDGGVQTSAGSLSLGGGVGIITVEAIGGAMDEALRMADEAPGPVRGLSRPHGDLAAPVERPGGRNGAMAGVLSDRPAGTGA